MDKWVKRFNSAPLHRKKENSSSESLRTFSVSLDQLSRRDNSDIPLIMRKLCEHILDVGKHLEGIFRVNGNARLIENLRSEFDSNGDADLISCKDIYGIAGLLKYFLRELPEGLVPEKITDCFIEIISENDDDKIIISNFRLLLEDLPSVNFTCMKFLCHFLRKIADNEIFNKMSPVSLGIVFGPNVFRCGEDMRGLQNQGFTNQIMRFFIDRYYDVFEPKATPSSNLRVIQVQESNRGDSQRVISLNAFPKPDPVDRFDPRPKPRTSLQQQAQQEEPLRSQHTRSQPQPVQQPHEQSQHVQQAHDQFQPEQQAHKQPQPVQQAHKQPQPVQQAHKQPQPVQQPHKQPQRHRPSEEPRSAPSVRVSDEVSSPRVHSPIALDRPFVDSEWQSLVSPRGPSNHEQISPTIQSAIREVVSENLFGTDQCAHSLVMESSLPAQGKPEPAEPVPVPEPKARPSNNGLEQVQLLDMDLTGLTDHTPAPMALSENRFLTGPPARRRTKPAFLVPEESTQSVKAVPATGSSLVPSLDLTGLGVGGNRHSLPGHHPDFEKEQVATKEPLPPPPVPPPPSSDVPDLRDKFREPPGGAHTTPSLYSPPLAEEEERQKRQQLRSQTLKRIRTLKSRLRTYEEQFMREHGRAPTSAEKSSAPSEEVRLCWAQLGRERRLLRKLRDRESDGGLAVGLESGGESAAGDGESESELSLPAAAAPAATTPVAATPTSATTPTPSSAVAVSGHAANHGGRQTPTAFPEDRVVGGVTSAPSSAVSTVKGTPASSARSIADSLDLIMTRLMDKRRVAGRPEALAAMNDSQVRAEKLALQKALLYFENIHGRPRSAEEKEVMKPLYDRYRAVKRLLGRSSGGHATPNSGLQSASVISVPTAGREEEEEAEEDVFQLTRDFRLISSTTSAGGGLGNKNSASSNIAAGRRTLGMTVSATLDRKTTATTIDPRDADLRELMNTQNTLKSEKKKLQRTLKQFEHDFEENKGHKVEKEDRLPMRSEYNQYKKIKTKLKQVERRIESLTYATK